MSFGQDNNYNSDSIFSSELKNNSDTTVPIMPPDIPKPSRESAGMIEGLVDRLIKKPLKDSANKKEKTELEKVVKENEELFKILMKYGCELVMQEDGAIINYPKMKLSGKIIVKNNQVEFDEDVKKIFQYIAQFEAKSGNLEQIIDSYEAQQFYPTGNLEKQTVTYQGKEVEVMVGTFMNPQKKIKKVYIYNGREIFPE